jgi:hypothetical protein
MEGQLRAAGMPAAILWSSDYPSLNPGYWVTYSGEFDSSQAAAAHLATLQRAGFSGRVRPVISATVPPPGPSEQPYWTAIAGSFGTSVEAATLADELRSRGYDGMVLYSGDYSSLNPGYWIAHVGRFADQGGAAGMAQRLRHVGYPAAYPREIRR